MVGRNLEGSDKIVHRGCLLINYVGSKESHVELFTQPGDMSRRPQEHLVTRTDGDITMRAVIPLLAIVLTGFSSEASKLPTFFKGGDKQLRYSGVIVTCGVEEGSVDRERRRTPINEIER